MADYLLAEEKDLIYLPDELSYADGAQVACGFGTVYEGLQKIGVNGNDSVLITGLGPVGLATAALCRQLGARKIIGIDVIEERMKLAKEQGLCDTVLAGSPDNAEQVRKLTGGAGVERAGDTQGPSAVPCHDRPGKAVGGVVRNSDRVRLVLERHQRRDRPEDLLARNPVGGPRPDERAREPEALAVGRAAAAQRPPADASPVKTTGPNNPAQLTRRTPYEYSGRGLSA